MNDLEKRISANVESVRERMASAAIAADRDPVSITLVAVTKYVDAEFTRSMHRAGCRTLGENRPQQLDSKANRLATETGITWHLIGHLQRNKVDMTLKHAELIHSVDSLRLLEAIDKSATKVEKVQDILIEVNISGDESKHGFAPSDLGMAIEKAATLPSVNVRGLMTMAALVGGAETADRNFAEMQKLHQTAKENCPDGIDLTELSMGMSGDFELAIRRGATIVRVGSALIEGCR